MRADRVYRMTYSRSLLVSLSAMMGLTWCRGDVPGELQPGRVGQTPSAARPEDRERDPREGFYSQLRAWMVASQLRSRDIDDRVVLEAMGRVPRHLYVPELIRRSAYDDRPLPIGEDQTISQPYIVAYMTQALGLEPGDRVLEIGTGSGYQAAVLAKLCRRLYTIERHKELLNAALEHFATLRLHNIIALCGDGTLGWPEQAPFERIIVTAAHAGRDPPKALTDQLGVGGVMVIPMGDDRRDQYVMRYRRTDTGLERDVLWPVRFVPLLPDPPERPVHTGHI